MKAILTVFNGLLLITIVSNFLKKRKPGFYSDDLTFSGIKSFSVPIGKSEHSCQ
jgi:hypothetical protein